MSRVRRDERNPLDALDQVLARMAKDHELHTRHLKVLQQLSLGASLSHDRSTQTLRRVHNRSPAFRHPVQALHSFQQ